MDINRYLVSKTISSVSLNANGDGVTWVKLYILQVAFSLFSFLSASAVVTHITLKSTTEMPGQQEEMKTHNVKSLIFGPKQVLA